MSLPPYLTDEEIQRITRPLKQGAARIKYIRRVYKCAVEPSPDGQPMVRRVDFEAVRAAGAANDPAPAEKPDWTVFNQKVSYGRGAAQKKRQSAGT